MGIFFGNSFAKWGNGQFFCYFLTDTFCFVMLNNLLMHIRTTVYSLVLLIVMDD